MSLINETYRRTCVGPGPFASTVAIFRQQDNDIRKDSQLTARLLCLGSGPRTSPKLHLQLGRNDRIRENHFLSLQIRNYRLLGPSALHQ